MSAQKVTLKSFSAASKVYSGANDGLAAIVRDMLITQARFAVKSSTVLDFTDNSTGTDGSGTVANVPAVATINASSLSVGTPRTALNTAIGKVNNALSVLAENVNIARALLGLPAITYSGTVATPGTIPACDKTLAATSGTSTATYASTKTSVDAMRADLKTMVYRVNECLIAIGATPLVDNIAGSIPLSATIGDAGNTTASASGSDAASDASVDAALTAIVGGIATIAAKWNSSFAQASQATTPLLAIAG